LINSRRSKIDILNDILNLAKGNVNKTKILYSANLSYAQLTDYLDFLLDKGLLEKKDFPTRKFRTTQKGLEFLASSKKIHEILGKTPE
jgi:predicted transcriptional regulator